MTHSQRTALITGGSSGIGQGIALAMAREGYDVAITYGHNKAGAEETRTQVAALGRRCAIIEAHMEDPEAPARAVDQAHEALGRIDVLVSNAATDRRLSVLTVTPEELSWMMQVDFGSYLLCAGAAARHMIRDGIKGCLFFITSTRGERAYFDNAVYGGLKAGVNHACASIALDLAPHGIRAICIAPGATRVRPLNPERKSAHPIEDAIPMGRMGLPADSGALIAFLASERASYITGVTIRVDGGLALMGPPEGYADAHWIDPAWTKGHYEQIMREKEHE